MAPHDMMTLNYNAMKFKSIILVVAAFFSVQSVASAYEERNLISSRLEQVDLKSVLVTDGSWLPFPDYPDREGWQRLFGDFAHKAIAEGEKYLGYEWKLIPASAYLEYERTGERQVMEKPFDANRKALNVLALAELAEGKGRFIDDIANGLWMNAHMPSWVLSAHLPRQSSGRSLPDTGEQIIDLGSGGNGALVSIVCHLFEDEMNSLDPSIVRAVKDAVREKILEPYLDMSIRKANWWMADDWRPGQIINNWNPWCNSNVLICFLLMEDNPDVLEEAVRLSAISTDRFLNYVKGDGACEEGPAYWGHAAGKLYDYLKVLYEATGGQVDLFGNDLVRSMGEYISRSYIGDGWVVNFADATARMTPDIPLVYRYGKDCGSREMMDFALYLLGGQDGFRHASVPLWNDAWRSLETLRYLGEMNSKVDSLNFLCKGNRAVETPARVRASLRKAVPHCTWYPETEFAYMRNENGWFLAAKGGFNNESHNHNDVGTFILYIDDVPVFIEAGVGTYTRKTFSHERYTIWSMRSDWHNLPQINGSLQIFGPEFKAADTECDIRRLSFSADISGAYSGAAHCSSWTRSYSLGRDRLDISDRFLLSERMAPDTVNFLVQGAVYLPGDKVGVISGKENSSGREILVNQGEIVIVNGNVAVALSYPHSMSVSVKEMPLDDPRLSNVWGSSIRRISFSAQPSAPLKGSYGFRVRRIF